MKLEELGRERDCVRWYGQEFRALIEGTGIYKLPRSGLLEHWHEQIGDPTMVDAILDRLVHNAHKIQMKVVSMRKKNANLTE